VGNGLQQVDFYLQRGVRKLAQDLRLGFDFQGHQVQNQHTQRTNVLVKGAVLGHDEDVFAFQHFCCRQCVGDADGH